MRSTTSRSPEPPSSLLEESSYDLLNDSALDTSDDEAHTESLASDDVSTEPPTPDDASVFSEDDDLENDYAALDQSIRSLHSGTHDQEEPEKNETPLIFGEEDSILTEVANQSEGGEKVYSIQLDEHRTEDLAVIQGSKTIRSLPDQTSELPETFSRYGCSQIRLVAKAGLAEHVMLSPDSYRIIFVGMPEKWLEDCITAQIGAALTASPRISRSVMVRGQMEPYGPVIHVYHCTKLRFLADDTEPAGLVMSFEDGKEVAIEAGYTPPDSRPDLIIFCHQSGPNKQQDFSRARAILNNIKIPSIDIAEVRPYGDGFPSYDQQSLAACIEGRDSDDAEFELKEVLPLDHYTFSELDPSQLNRHLALISPHLSASGPSTSQESKFCPTTVKKMLSARSLAPSKAILSLVALVGMITTLLLNPVYTSLVLQKMSHSAEQYLPSSIMASGDSVLSAPLTSRNAASILTSASVKPALKDLMFVPQVFTTKEAKEVDEKNGGFILEPSGDHRFLLTPSSSLTNARKKPQLHIIVSRDTKPVPIHYNRTLSGGYVVALENQYTLCSFQVNIVSYSKPLMKQSFDIMLGHNKSRLSLWIDESVGTIMGTRKVLRNLSSSNVYCIKQHMQAKISGMLGVDLGYEVHNLEREIKDHFRSTRKAVINSPGAGYELAKRLPASTWRNVRKATAPVRTSRTLWRARMNALRVRCNAEKAAGLSPWGADKTPSWACSKVAMLDDDKDE